MPVIFLCRGNDLIRASKYLKSGINDVLFDDELWKLPFSIQKVLSAGAKSYPDLLRRNPVIVKLLKTIQDLSRARKLRDVIDIVKHSARALVNSDGATFVIREGGESYYADEDAIAPLWKGKRFPMEKCIGGWAMLNREQVVIEDVYQDIRIPYEAYRPTFIQSLVMTPVRKDAPIASIGVYWARQHKASPEEIALLQTLADTTSVALENVELLSDLEHKVEEKTTDLSYANKELEAFSFSLSHDLRAPLRAVDSFSRVLSDRYSSLLPEKGSFYLSSILSETSRMGRMIDDMLRLFRLSSSELKFQEVDLSEVARSILSSFSEREPKRQVSTDIQDGMIVWGDVGLLTAVMQNLLSNAWKYTSKKDHSRIEVSARPGEKNSLTILVRDNGAGFDMNYAQKLFEPFRRFHTDEEFQGTGVGLAIVKRIIDKHGGRIWAESKVNEGSAFHFTLMRPESQRPPEKGLKMPYAL